MLEITLWNKFYLGLGLKLFYLGLGLKFFYLGLGLKLFYLCAEGLRLSRVTRTKSQKFAARSIMALLQKMIIFLGTGRGGEFQWPSLKDLFSWRVSVFFSAGFSVWVNWASGQSDYLRQRVITAVRISVPKRHLQVKLSLCTSWSYVGRVGLWRNLFLTSALD